ncbi:hypothetical protein FOQG_15052 [Fusarium oxysporum f. sp. raphani 54005]|uniref:Uncharacterized protein n=9 Tax=Fusarium oxysporum TaxID=5507 RepID=X0CCM6_FUSOX|nr:uncharacterized protein FOBCDRAFT_227565 [Fusarium oxysporum Fo47]EGU73819.1 hypothetical protein FOXB_15669 [Fusarium oxysporum f. sp. conglutinans Fo5176]EXK80412.1 hypothetical protein FOQG_15052 [Fusarium oxysporum f. sp. raphani 54005]EXL65744.1 hypothetical protein FOPG_18050 [Fusarium oxysporum f. sp. conglutinans race 2 54008]KAF6515768.1 hypothetical protein HZS61_004509 [Fusarium oxysporum f. sp. conglutinans]KAG7418709.1 hypothetical protein Forpi1262_v016478 [Fusarium oxysporum 
MAAMGYTLKPKHVAESHIQLIIQELRDMDRGLRNTVKHQQIAVEASLVEWRRRELSTNANTKNLMEGIVPNN